MNRIAFELLFITDGFEAATPGRVDAALAATVPGHAAVQLRARELSGRALVRAAAALVEVARSRGALLLVNDRVDVALAADADGVHLPASGLPPSLAKQLGPRLVVGVSTHSAAEAERAARDGADYVTFGPVYPTASKAAYGPPLGLAPLAELARASPIPVFALGGVDAARARECVAVGARVACIGAVLGSADPAAGARALARSRERSA